VYETANIACDHNLLTMEVLRITAKRHGLTCLLHEKPFDGVNGSGKHNNFSLSTDDGINFLSPGKHPEENKLFLLTLCTLIEVVDDYADLIRLTAATPGNDARLGGNEAPPPIISIFLGEQLTAILNSIASGISPDVQRQTEINADVDVLPNFRKDDSDRNRTSPFAFTGNKFEFRMLGSSQSIALCNTVLNTAIADVFGRFADRLEAASSVEEETARLIAETIRDHGRVIFNGNNYTAEWLEEAKRRGLPVLTSSLDAFDSIIDPKNVAMLSRSGVLSETECHARHEILLENFVKVLSIEAETMLQMTSRQIFPAAGRYLGELAGSLRSLLAVGGESKAMEAEVAQLSELLDLAWTRHHELAAAFHAMDVNLPLRQRAAYVEAEIRPRMAALRVACDNMEDVCDETLWPMPTYTDLLHRV
jgi:glutamine synthetase